MRIYVALALVALALGPSGHEYDGIATSQRWAHLEGYDSDNFVCDKFEVVCNDFLGNLYSLSWCGLCDSPYITQMRSTAFRATGSRLGVILGTKHWITSWVHVPARIRRD